ncbi:MAG: D-alanyl-D-alanine carboxypeptidase family protein [Pseudomonadota bacterium]
MAAVEPGVGRMRASNLLNFCLVWGALAAAFTAYFNIQVRLDEPSAVSRYETLSEAKRYKAAAKYGEIAARLKQKAARPDSDLPSFLAKLGATHFRASNYDRSAVALDRALGTNWASTLLPTDLATYEDMLATSHLKRDNVASAVAIYASFLDRAGDFSAGVSIEGYEQEAENEKPSTAPRNSQDLADWSGTVASAHIESSVAPAYLTSLIKDASPLFSETVGPLGDRSLFPTSKDEILGAAENLAELGAYYASGANSQYAAAGLLSSAYALRREVLGPDHQDTVQIALMLGPVYLKIGRSTEAENLYLDAFHAQEKIKGSNNPDLSLYIRLLAGVYELQGRATEAQALYVHMRDLFQDAFGEKRYAANKARDLSVGVDRPVSQDFVLAKNYWPTDLVPAAQFSIPLSKNPNVDEMKLRLAVDPSGSPREDNLPARLAQLISLCGAETGERLSLRSGFRSYGTQNVLFQRFGHKGTVAPPGMSEHQTGLAADIDVDRRLMRQSDKSFRCFNENAFRFGFILSYPLGNTYLPTTDSFEPWHWRYVGVSAAHLYRETGPLNKPQEFLANLNCYQERAEAGAFTIAGEDDICLKGVGSQRVTFAKAVSGNEPEQLKAANFGTGLKPPKRITASSGN